MKVFGALLFGLVLGAGVGANAATTASGTTPTGKARRHSAGTTRVATTVRARSGASHAGSAHSGSTRSGSYGGRTHVVATHGVVGRHRGARPTLAVRRTRYQEHFSASSFADNLTLGDVVEGEDPLVRAAAIEALGNMNGTAIAIDPSTGRILAMVNQKLALSRGAEPCSTIKLTVALAALEEGIVRKDTPVNLGGRYHMTMTDALAHSNNLYFETLGRQLGFERVKHYANEFGLGELAGYHIQGEQLGTYPDEVLPASLGGVGRMCSFGESVSMTPLQLGALVSAIANGGTLYYLQHPETAVDVATFEPKVKRVLDIAPLIPEISVGMSGAVEYGTARSLRANFSQFPVMGKTGTCSNNGTRFGWFGSFADTPKGQIVTVFFLEGGRPTFGPKAAELTGEFYRALWNKDYFLQKQTVESNGVMGGSE
nr:penicillin-binding transpeptidase domain-containing protein [Edaphobacter lichenicola]